MVLTYIVGDDDDDDDDDDDCHVAMPCRAVSYRIVSCRVMSLSCRIESHRI